MGRVRFLGAALALAAVLSACGGAAAPSGSSRAAAPASGLAAASAPAVPSGAAPAAASAAASSPAAGTKVVVGLSQTIAQFLPPWVARDQGLYAKHGLNVDQRSATATTIMASLLSGELSLAVTGGPEVLNATANGAELVVAGNLAPVAALKLIVGKSIQSKDDMAHKRYGITRLGSTTHSNTRALLTQMGFNPDKDATYVQLDNNAAIGAALISGQIDAALLAPPESVKLTAQGFRVMYDLGQLKYPATGQLIVIPRAWLTSHHDAAQAFVDSLMDANGLIRRDKAAAEGSLKTNMKLEDQQLLDGVYDYFVGSIIAPVPYAEPEQLANDLAVVNQATGKLKDFDVKTIIDNSLVKSAVDRGIGKA